MTTSPAAGGHSAISGDARQISNELRVLARPGSAATIFNNGFVGDASREF